MSHSDSLVKSSVSLFEAIARVWSRETEEQGEESSVEVESKTRLLLTSGAGRRQRPHARRRPSLFFFPIFRPRFRFCPPCRRSPRPINEAHGQSHRQTTTAIGIHSAGNQRTDPGRLPRVLPRQALRMEKKARTFGKMK